MHNTFTTKIPQPKFFVAWPTGSTCNLLLCVMHGLYAFEDILYKTFVSLICGSNRCNCVASVAAIRT